MTDETKAEIARLRERVWWLESQVLAMRCKDYRTGDWYVPLERLKLNVRQTMTCEPPAEEPGPVARAIKRVVEDVSEGRMTWRDGKAVSIEPPAEEDPDGQD